MIWWSSKIGQQPLQNLGSNAYCYITILDLPRHILPPSVVLPGDVLLARYIVSNSWTGQQNQVPMLYRVDMSPNIQSARNWMDGAEADREVWHAHSTAPQSFFQRFIPLPCFLLGVRTRSVPVGWRQARHYYFSPWPSQLEWKQSYKKVTEVICKNFPEGFLDNIVSSLSDK